MPPGPHHTKHFGYRQFRCRYKMQNEHRHSTIEIVFTEGYRTGITLPCGYPLIGIALYKRFDELLFEVDGLDGGDIRSFRDQERQAAGTASNIYDALAICNSSEIQKKRSQTLAPSSHVLIIAIGTLCNESRGHVSPRKMRLPIAAV